MPIKVVCPQCHKSLNAPDSAAGRTASCPQCKGKIKIPPAATTVTAQPAPQIATAKPSKVAASGTVATTKPHVPVATVVSTSGRAKPPNAAAVSPIIVKAAPPPLPGGAKPMPLDALPALAPLDELDSLPAFDSLAGPDLLDGLSIDALGGDPLGQGAPLASSPLAAPARPRRNIDLLPVMIIAGVVLVAGLVMGGVYLLMRGGSRGDWMKFMPDDAQMIVHVDMDAIRRSGLYEKMKQMNPSFDAQIQQGLRGTSLRFEDISSVGVGGSFDAKPKFVAVLKTNRSISESEMRGPNSVRQEQIGDYTVYHEQEFAGARIDDRTLLAGTPELVKAVLTREGPARLQGALQTAMADANFSSSVTLAVALKGLTQNSPALPGAPFDPKQVESVAVSADLGSSIDIAAAIFFDSDSSASGVKEKIDQQMNAMRQMSANMPPQMQPFKEVMDSLRVSQSGRKIAASVRIPQSVIDQATSGVAGAPQPAAGALPNTPGQSPTRPAGVPGRRRSSRPDPNLPPTAPSRGLF